MPPKFATLSSSKKAASHDDEESDDDTGPAANNFFVGGGQNVIGPKGGKSAADEIVKKATEVAKAAAASGAEQPTGHHATITMYENGFTVKVGEEAEGELRGFEAPENKGFMDAIKMGRVPPELAAQLGGRPGKDLDVAISNKMTEKYVPPSYRAFSGAGGTTGKTAAPTSAVVRGSGSGAASVLLDPTAPTTRVQVKLVNGKKETITLNLTHTVGDLQTMVASLNGSGGKPFVLTGGFPPRPLDVAAATLEAAGLKNASVTQVLA